MADSKKKTQQTDREFELKNDDFGNYWCSGKTPEEAIVSAIKNGCDFTGKCELYELTKLGDYTLEQKIVATPVKK